MDGVPLGPGFSDAFLDAVAGHAEAAARRSRALADDVDALRMTRASPRSEVEVTVDGAGRVVDIVFSERFRSVEPGALAMMVLACVRRAQGALADRVGELAGASDPATRAVVDGYRRRFPSVPDPPAPPRPSEPPEQPGSWLR